jgi:hypothetical protein
MYLTGEPAELRRDYLKFFLGVLCDFRGELLCFFMIKLAAFQIGGGAPMKLSLNSL